MGSKYQGAINFYTAASKTFSCTEQFVFNYRLGTAFLFIYCYYYHYVLDFDGDLQILIHVCVIFFEGLTSGLGWGTRIREITL